MLTIVADFNANSLFASMGLDFYRGRLSFKGSVPVILSHAKLFDIFKPILYYIIFINI